MVLPNGYTQKGIVLGAARGFGRGAEIIIGLHPATRAIVLSTPRLPRGGTLVACGVSDAGCVELANNREGQRHRLLSPDAHTTLRLRGTWASPVAIERIVIDYEAVDDYFSVDLVDP